MSNESIQTTQLHGWLERMRAGDQAACDELLQSVCERLKRLTRKMLKGFPDVERWEDTDDVLNKALMRLLRALKTVDPQSVRDFYSLAAVQIRRELLDMAKHYRGVNGWGANHDSVGNWNAGDRSSPAFDPADGDSTSGQLELWTAFHEAVETLPPQEREVISLVFYHNWTQQEIADLFQVSVRTIRRQWSSACQKLYESLGGALPDITN